MVLFLNIWGKTYAYQQDQAQQLIDEVNNNCDLYAISGGKIIRSIQHLQSYSNISVLSKLKGGKGGFGAKLKTEGGKKVKPNENMFSRDIQGRPLAYATVEKDYREYCEKKIQEEKNVKNQLAQFRVMENTLKEQYAGMKLDRTYHAQLQQTEKKLSSSLRAGLDKYLKKKKQESQGKKVSEQPQQKKQMKISDDDIQPNKRQRPSKQLSQQCDKGPSKKIKLVEQSQTEQRPQTIQETKPKTQAPKLLSARDKLKSLFKK